MCVVIQASEQLVLGLQTDPQRQGMMLEQKDAELEFRFIVFSCFFFFFNLPVGVSDPVVVA